MLALRLALLAVVAIGVAPAGAFKIDRRIVPQPKVQYFVALKDWRKPIDRAVKALNRARVGVKLVKADIPEQASVQVGRLDHQCFLPGVSATTQTLVGGYAVLYLPHNCHGAQASIIAAHELGHALGLKHDDRSCQLMNSSGTGPQSIPTGCLGQSFNWLKKPWRASDLAGLRKLYRNTPPKLKLRLTGPATVPAGTPVRFAISVADRERNLSELRVNYGDGTAEERLLDDPPPTSHTYSAPGTYRITATASDFYGKRGRKSVTVTVTP
jgi:hypothetical protein